MSKRPSPEYRLSSYTHTRWGEYKEGLVTETFPYQPYYREYTSSVTPNWHAMLHRQPLPENAYHMFRRILHGSDFFWQVINNVDGRILQGATGSTLRYFGSGAPPSPYHSRYETDARARAAMKINEKLSSTKFNAAQFFVERRQTADLIADTAYRIVNAAKALKRADLRAFTRSLSLTEKNRSRAAKDFKRVARTSVSKRLANHWLEVKYGWRPLLSDIHDAAELLAQRAVNPVRNGGRVTGGGNAVINLNVRAPRGQTSHICYDYSGDATISVQARARYTLDSEAVNALAVTGLTNPLSLAWEILPYSFVVDWFLPVGNYLSALSAHDGFTLSRTSTSILTKWSLTMDMRFHDAGEISWYRTEFGSGSATESVVALDRFNTLPGIPLSVRNPIGGNAVDRMVTAASLLAQVFGR